MFRWFAFADDQSERLTQPDGCRPDDAPPYDDPRCADCNCLLPHHWDGCAQLITSPWVKRSQANDLPTFDRHNGAFAFGGR